MKALQSLKSLENFVYLPVNKTWHSGRLDVFEYRRVNFKCSIFLILPDD